METVQEMRQVSVSEILEEHNLVVPEIQREYVWGRNDYGILESFLENIIKEFKTEISPQLKKIMNIGFLYSYKPNYSTDNEDKDVYLIDGQQRFTTIFLILFYLSIKENRKGEFIQLYRIELAKSKIAFDYRVRSLTHDFIIELVKNCSEIEDLLTIREKRWFLSNYKKDTTIKSIVGDEKLGGAFKIINNILKSESNKYFDFVSQNIKFWHFKTEETSQGEELYITMNSRGQQLADNETIRARLFQSGIAKDDPLRWSRLWEEWQDLFWKNRSDGATSADKGFNEFLACIGGLENFKKDKIKYSKENYESFKKIDSKVILNSLTLPTIESYIDALKYINKNKNNFKSNYFYSAWVDKCINEMWSIFNEEQTNWYADSTTSSRGTERNRMVFVWSVLEFYTRQKEEIKTDSFFKFFRIFYLRYHNNNRSVSTIFTAIKDYAEKGVCGEDNSEEHLKYKLINKISEKEVKAFESLIWEIEDHKFNLDGRDVGGVNIGYLIDLEKEYSLLEIRHIKNRLYEIFPLEKKKYLTIQNILLYYGEYWQDVNPWYYRNFEFDNWKRIIRDRDQNNKHTRKTFKRFFDEFILFDGTPSDFLLIKRKTILKKADCETLRQKFCWYNQYLSDNMWSKGNHIALREREGNDGAFPNEHKFYNIENNFTGNKQVELFDLLPAENKI